MTDLSDNDSWVEIFNRNLILPDINSPPTRENRIAAVEFSPPFNSPYLRIFCTSSTAKDSWVLAGWITIYIGNIENFVPVRFFSKKIFLDEWQLVEWVNITKQTTQLKYDFQPPFWFKDMAISVEQYQEII
ncbi:MAG: hypothetical protein F6K48_17665 [Okeania sp. SIO3H1]|nr:hypothetical protein [Okeania sp. SIO3H1]